MNVIPVIAKADTIARSELTQFKGRVSGRNLGVRYEQCMLGEFEELARWEGL